MSSKQPRPYQEILIQWRERSTRTHPTGEPSEWLEFVSVVRFYIKTYPTEGNYWIPFLGGYVLLEAHRDEVEILNWVGFDFITWHEQYDLDNDRIAQNRKELGKKALSKLTDEEIKALGIWDSTIDRLKSV